MKDLTLYSERITPVQEHRADFGVSAGLGVGDRTRIASQSTCLTRHRTSTISHDAETKCETKTGKSKMSHSYSPDKTITTEQMEAEEV